MQTLTIVVDDKLIIVDGVALNFEFEIDQTIWAVQWQGQSGHIEYRDINTVNEEIDSIAQFQYLVDAHSAEKARLEAEAEKLRKESEELAKEQAKQTAVE